MLFIKLLKKCSHRVWFRIGLSSKLWKRYIHTGSVSLMCRTVQQAPETVYAHGVCVHVRLSSKHWKMCIRTGSVSLSDCPESTGNCVCTPRLGSNRTIYKAQKTVRLSSRHRKMCMYTMSGFLSDCPSSTGNCVYTRGQCPCQTVHQALYTVCTQCLGSYLAVYQAAEAARTQNLAHCFEPRAQCEVTDKS